MDFSTYQAKARRTARYPVIGEGGVIYVHVYDTLQNVRLWAVGPAGESLWSIPASGQYGPPAIAADGTIYSSDSGTLVAVNRDGSAKWSCLLADEWLNHFAIGGDGTVYATGSTGLHAISPAGQEKWSYVSPSLRGGVVDVDGSVIVTVSDTAVALTSDGGVKWKTAVSGLRGGSAAICSDGVIYFGSDSGLCALDRSGDRLWTRGGFRCDPNPIVAPDGTVYVAGYLQYEPRLYAFQGSAGPADSPWPMYQHDARHSGWAGTR